MQKSDQSAIFNIFHDGTFLSLQRKENDIHFRIEIAYLATMIDPTFTYFTGVLKNCQQFLLQSWEDEKKRYEDIHTISILLMNMEISNAKFDNMQVFVHCLDVVGGDTGSSLIFSCESVMIFDEGRREATFSELQAISRRYWKLL